MSIRTSTVISTLKLPPKSKKKPKKWRLISKKRRTSSEEDDYKKNLMKVLRPIRHKGSKQRCDNLIAVYNEIKGVKRNINPEIIDKTNKFKDLFVNDLRVSLKKRSFKNSGLMTADLFSVFKKILISYGVSNLCEFSVQQPFIISSKTSYRKNTIKTAMFDANNDKKYIFQRCLNDTSINYIVGFVNLYAKRFKSVGVIDHKNAIIIDKKNKKIIRFEPKKKDALFLKYVRHDLTELEVRDKLNSFGFSPDELSKYEYIMIRGNQPNMSLSNDSIYCAVYSLYAALLFSVNYDNL